MRVINSDGFTDFRIQSVDKIWNNLSKTTWHDILMLNYEWYVKFVSNRIPVGKNGP